jgi:hypothetical protein
VTAPNACVVAPSDDLIRTRILGRIDGLTASADEAFGEGDDLRQRGDEDGALRLIAKGHRLKATAHELGRALAPVRVTSPTPSAPECPDCGEPLVCSFHEGIKNERPADSSSVTTEELALMLAECRRSTIEACAKLCEEEAGICSRQKESTHSRDRQRLVHEGGECIARTLLHRINRLATDEASKAGGGT